MAHPVVPVATPNPLGFVLDRLGMTRAAFGVKYELSKPYLLKVSQGRASSLSEYVSMALLEEAEIRGIDLDEDLRAQYGYDALDLCWQKWIVDHRSAQTLPAPSRSPDLNPFARLVASVGGVARMAAILAVPDFVVSRYVKGLSKTMPEPIETAMMEMGYPHVQSLKEAMIAWSCR